MPYGEARARARRVADEVLGHSFVRFAELTGARGIAAAILALNVVIDDVPPIPLRHVLERSGLQVFDLFDVYPADQHAALRVAPWDDHPNAAAHEMIATYVVRHILLESRDGSFGAAGSTRRGEAAQPVR